MIVYNVQRTFHALKADADAQRRATGLPASAINTIRIEDRDELAAFLNALCAAPSGVPAPELQGVQPVPSADTDAIPPFILRDWERRAQFRKGQ